MQTNTPATWPDNTKLNHPAKVAAIKTICAQSRQSQPLPTVWPERVAAAKGGAR